MPKYYVIEPALKLVISGPHDTYAAADKEVKNPCEVIVKEAYSENRYGAPCNYPYITDGDVSDV